MTEGSSSADVTATNPLDNFTSKLSAASFKLDKFPKLTNQTDYPLWRDSAKLIFEVMGCWTIVDGTREPPVKAEGEDDKVYQENLDHYLSLYRWASIFFLETVDFQEEDRCPSV